jgi:hypothetical protein
MLLVAIVPAAVLAAARVVFLVLAAWGLHPFWMWEPLNLAEAAALRDGGEVARLLAEGADPNATYRVRRGFVREHMMQLTPIAAARAARRDEIVELLEDAGATAESPQGTDTP